MILTTIDRLADYNALHPLFAEAVDFLRHKAAGLADGRYELHGEELFVTLTTVDLRPADEALLEAHDQYIDIQYVIRGEETYGWAPREACRVVERAMDTEADILFFGDAVSSYVSLNDGGVVVFFPEDSHAPLIGTGRVRKAIVKVRK